MTIKSYLSTKTDKNGYSELYMRIVISRAHVYRIKTGIRLPNTSWNKKKEKVIVPRLHTVEQIALIQIQARIDNLENRLTDQICRIPIEKLNKPSIIQIVKAFNKEYIEPISEQIESNPFQNAFDSFIKLQVKTHKRVQQYHCLWDQMQRFATFKKGSFVWRFEIDAEDILEFEQFLLIEPSFFDDNRKPKKEYEHLYNGTRIPVRIKRGQNAVNCIIKRLRIFFNWAEKSRKFTCPNAFTNYQSHQCVYGTPYFMTKEEINTLYAKDFSHDARLEFHRDLFVFQSNVGIRVGDLFALTKQNIVNGDHLEYIASKTIAHSGKSISVPLTKTAKTILAKYHDDTRTELFPFINTVYYNRDIKVVLKQAGITRVVTIFDPLTSTNVQKPICEIAASHMARRNFIGNLYNKVADPNIIGSMTGHVDGSKAFARYRTIGEDLKKKAISALE